MSLDGIPYLRCVKCTHSLVSFASLLRAHCVPLSMSFMTTLKSISPSTDPWGIPLTDLHPDIEQLITTLWVWSCNQFLVDQTVHPPDPYLSNLERRMWWGPCQRPYWSPDILHLWLFPCLLTQLCCHRRPLGWWGRIPCWSHAGCLVSPPSIFLCIASRSIISWILPSIEVRLPSIEASSVVPWIFLSTLL